MLTQRDGAAQVVPRLRSEIHPCQQETIWDHCALNYTYQGRHHEALTIYSALYQRQIELQSEEGVPVRKGTPLVRMADAHTALGHAVLAKRYMMLTLIEDAIACAGSIPAETTGTYFRLVWQYGISHDQLGRYASEAWRLWLANQSRGIFPEWILQELDQDWMSEYPTPGEAAIYAANTAYVKWLMAGLGSDAGRSLERIAHYVLSCVPGFRARMRTRNESTDYDVICAPEGPPLDFRAELGRYFLCECKDWEKPADVTAVVKFAGVLRSAKCRFGVIFSKSGITGADKTQHAERELLKIFQHDDLTILVVSNVDLDQVANGANFLSILRDKYERTRLDLPKTPSVQGR